MEYTISPSENKKYIVLKTTGDITGANVMKLILDAQPLSRNLGTNKFLIDVSESKNIETAVANYKFAYNDMKHTDDFDSSATIAVVSAIDDHSHDFVETVMQNAGFDFKLFRDRQEAINYLIEE